ncbi:hypothetical protein BO70DRAFT_432872 [Aspergillus heteromorphus CBS 117.55]|uniref:Uncharacterized protein n=1 Tax=Aspergillus heteromorphus CBS 117.55 TaxID=1448321 RepID=A0A317V704_9EURO|nr:uncharacterized protein BO70DRAFT_432872 [Aspergillus heteromorphus CBS 117.55]PWY67920.1 hypothetical protein BO70DRAFT_432872 [Aspergillus heteromorphus CBS 117.55]
MNNHDWIDFDIESPSFRSADGFGRCITYPSEFHRAYVVRLGFVMSSGVEGLGNARPIPTRVVVIRKTDIYTLNNPLTERGLPEADECLVTKHSGTDKITEMLISMQAEREREGEERGRRQQEERGGESHDTERMRSGRGICTARKYLLRVLHDAEGATISKTAR